MRRIALACLVFSIGIAVGLAVLRPGHVGRTPQERRAADAIAAASGGQVVQVTCAPDHCGAVVRPKAGSTCQGWVVPVAGGVLGRPARTAFVKC